MTRYILFGEWNLLFAKQYLYHFDVNYDLPIEFSKLVSCCRNSKSLIYFLSPSGSCSWSGWARSFDHTSSKSGWLCHSARANTRSATYRGRVYLRRKRVIILYRMIFSNGPGWPRLKLRGITNIGTQRSHGPDFCEK